MNQNLHSGVPEMPVVPKIVFNGIYQPVVFWKPVGDFECPGVVLNRYWISSTGILFDSKARKQCDMVRIYDPYTSYYAINNTYVRTVMLFRDGKTRLVPVHVLVARAFCPFPDTLYDSQYRIQVNHIDGVKYHNDYYNLENCDQSRNMRHVFETGLTNKPHFTKDEAELVCQMLQDGYSYDDIEDILRKNGCQIKQIHQSIYKIHSGEIWRGISCKYKLPNRPLDQRLSDDLVQSICKIASTENIYNPQIILDRLFDRSLLSDDQIKRYVASIRNVLNGRSHVDISSNYDLSGIDFYNEHIAEFKRTPKRRKYDDELINRICQALQDTGYTKPSQIFYYLGFKRSDMTQNEYASLLYLINNIYKRKTALEISKNYKF